MNSEQDDSSISTYKQFHFTIENNTVTDFSEVVDEDTWIEESIDSDDSFVIDGDLIRHTKQTTNGPEVTVFSDPEGDGFYTIISDSTGTDDDGSEDDVSEDDGSEDDGDDHTPESGEHKAFQFTIVDDQVTEVFEIKDGVPEPKSIDADDDYTVDSDGLVIHTEIESLGREINRYADINGDGLYLRVSEQFVPDTPGSGPFKIEDDLSYSPSDDDDLIAVRGGEDCHGGSGADQFVFREAAHLRIGDFSSSAGDLLVFDTGLGLTSVDHLASFVSGTHQDGENFVVDFGTDVSITFVGVQSGQPGQISWDDVSVLS